jgi:hypothetical protein
VVASVSVAGDDSGGGCYNEVITERSTEGGSASGGNGGGRSYGGCVGRAGRRSVKCKVVEVDSG